MGILKNSVIGAELSRWGNPELVKGNTYGKGNFSEGEFGKL